jgi:hypothetical protein
MLSIQEVNYFTKLVKEGKVQPVECPFDIAKGNHLVYSKVDEDFNVVFRCVDCEIIFKAGLNTEELIKSAIDKYKHLV